MNRGTLAAIVFGAGLAGAAAYYVQERMAGNDRNPDAGTELVENRDPGTLNGLVETLPQVQLPDRAGQPRSLHDWPGKSLVINFWATWCGPCRMLAPILEELSGQHPELKIVKVDVDENRELALRYGIESIPTLLVFKGGQVADRSVGLVSPQEILALVK